MGTGAWQGPGADVWSAAIVLLGLPGHVSWLLWAGNLLHSTAWPHRRIKKIAYVINCLIFFGSAAAGGWAIARLCELANVGPSSPPLLLYFAVCSANTLLGTLPWLVRRLTVRPPAVLVAERKRTVDLRAAAAEGCEALAYGRLWTSIPGNESLCVQLHEKRLALPRLPAALAGLRIVHLSDLHMTGRIGRRYFEEAFELVNAENPDLVLLTGDLLEREACWSWVPQTFGRLRARRGAYFVFGNHDIRIDHRRTRAELEGVGLIDVGERPAQVNIDGVDVLLAGNSWPWIGPPCEPSAAAPRVVERSFRVLLAHSPDQIRWARRRDFDLMLAGHVHGGQIQIPPLGPILAPSRYGVRYACGVFHEPPTVLHVSRGLSGKLPLRFFCPPEVSTLVLEPAANL